MLYWSFFKIEDEGVDGAFATAVGDVIDAVVIFVFAIFVEGFKFIS